MEPQGSSENRDDLQNGFRFSFSVDPWSNQKLAQAGVPWSKTRISARFSGQFFSRHADHAGPPGAGRGAAWGEVPGEGPPHPGPRLGQAPGLARGARDLGVFWLAEALFFSFFSAEGVQGCQWVKHMFFVCLFGRTRSQGSHFVSTTLQWFPPDFSFGHRVFAHVSAFGVFVPSFFCICFCLLKGFFELKAC